MEAKHSLEEIRNEIDKIDTKLLRLLTERADLVHEIGTIKRNAGLPIYAPEREESLLQALTQKNKGRLPADAVRAIYREIMSASLALEKDLTMFRCIAGSTSYITPYGERWDMTSQCHLEQ